MDKDTILECYQDETMLVEEKDLLKDRLKEIFGYSQFRGNQERIIRNLLDGRNTFVIMPTGAGKSLCYQLPAMINDGLAIVISPLIALMKNQVDQMNAYGVNARFLNSTLSKGEITKLKKDCMNGIVKLLYVAPESLNKEETIEFLKKVNVSFVAIDEAHCISEWGHDFRPEYRRIKTMIHTLGEMPVIALTATATPKVQIDIQKNLQMEEADVFMSSFNRKNLYYEVRPKKETKKQLIRFLKDNKGKSGIIYCLSRKKVEEIAQLLNVNGFKAAGICSVDAQEKMSLLLRYLPHWHYAEKHSILINAPADSVFVLVDQLDISESKVIRLLYWLRGMPSRMLNKEGMKNDRFIELERVTNEEIILGIIGQFWKPNGNLQLFSSAEFTDFNKAGFLKAVWNFKITRQSPTVSLLETETRVQALDETARRKFSRYWFVIRPFSGLIRLEILESIKKKAEGSLPRF